MASPFPGMDPYLEAPAFWMDFHHTLINYWREAIADVLPGEYEANVGERVYLMEYEPDSRKLIYPDVSVSDDDSPVRERADSAGGVATLEPVTIPIAIPEGPREAYVEILHLPERSLVTVLELLSPTNKEQPGYTEYLQKRTAILHQQVHLVELDLLVGGQRPPLQKPWPPGDYHYLVSRWQDRPDSHVYSWTVRDPLPVLPVPLRNGDPDVAVDLGAVFATAFERGRFRRRLARRGECPAPLSADDKTWAEQVAADAS